MNSMTLAQLRATSNAGGINCVTLKGKGAGFIVEIETRSGQDAFLVKSRSNEPRLFGNPTSALMVLLEVGIAVSKFDTTHWTPEQKDMTRSRQSRADAMREAHEAAAYNRWLAEEIQASIDNPRQSIEQDDIIYEIECNMTALPAVKRKRA